MIGLRAYLSPVAFGDATRIAKRYEEEAGPNVEARFASQLEHLLVLLKAQPDMGRRTTRDGVKFILMKSFPYHVFYRETTKAEVRIIRIRHAHRRPLTWL